MTDGSGTASVQSFTPNAMTVRVTGAQPGDHVVLNQNYDPGWTANGKAVLDWGDTVATEVRGRDATIVFRFVPRFLYAGIALFVATLCGIGFAYFRAAHAER